jgi:hypothetical protein
MLNFFLLTMRWAHPVALSDARGSRCEPPNERGHRKGYSCVHAIAQAAASRLLWRRHKHPVNAIQHVGLFARSTEEIQDCFPLAGAQNANMPPLSRASGVCDILIHPPEWGEVLKNRT